MMDPNFVKLYKMAQLTIEYLLVCLRILQNFLSTWIIVFLQLCQDQITTQLVDYEQTKTKSVQVRHYYSYR